MLKACSGYSMNIQCFHWKKNLLEKKPEAALQESSLDWISVNVKKVNVNSTRTATLINNLKQELCWKINRLFCWWLNCCITQIVQKVYSIKASRDEWCKVNVEFQVRFEKNDNFLSET